MISTTIQTTLVIGSFMCIYYSLNFWYPTVLRDAGRTNLLPFLAAFNVGAILGTATWGRLSEGRLGRRGGTLPAPDLSADLSARGTRPGRRR